MQQDAQILAIDAKIAADFIFVALLQKDFTQNPPVALGHLLENLANFLGHFMGIENSGKVHGKGWNLVLIVIRLQGIEAHVGAVVLEQNVVANRIHKGAQTLGMKNLPRSEGRIKSGKSFLTDIFDSVGRAQPRSELQMNQFAEINPKMFLRPEVSCSEALDIGFVKGVKLQERPPRVGKWQTV